MSEPDPEFPVPGPTLDFPIVGIGASAGGLKALLELFRAMPPEPGMAFVIILHLSPEYESHLDELLQRVTPMPVHQVTSAVEIERDRIYVISPKSHLRMRDRHLQPQMQVKRAGGPMTIDVFFETLAEAHRACAFALVLSGTGSDGMRGAKSIKAHGGVTLVQSPDEAEYDSMPRTVIDNGVGDFVLPVREMPAKLASLWDNAKGIRLPAPGKASPEKLEEPAEEALREVLSLTKARTRHDFSQYKRPTLLRRIERRLQITQLRDLPSYRDYIRAHPAESRNLLREFLISVTQFFRDDATFETLEKSLIPALFAEAPEGATIRIWVVGCATGEEVYSIAVLLAEHAATFDEPPEFSLFATDIDEQALAYARGGWYPESIRDQVSAERLERFFVKERDGYRVTKALRKTVMFAIHNVIQDPPFSRIDLVACRNLLIYLDRDAQRKVLHLLHFALRPEGYLLLGRAESVDERDGFSVVDKTHRIYRQRSRARAGVHLAAVPLAPNLKSPGDAALPPAPRRLSPADLHQRLLEHYAPPSVVVDDRFDVVHMSESAGRYLQLGPGEPSTNLLRVVPEELRFELRNALEQAMKSMQTTPRKYLPMRRGTEVGHVDVTVHPVLDRASSRTFALVLFDEAAEIGEGQTPAAPANDARQAVGIEDRLRDTEARLRAVVEQFEVQNEEATAANEELQATNEELRATSEELETGKEELQSINEELSTVNQELKNKIDEAQRIGDDLTNFMNATEIAALFVDRNLRLMRFTPFARDLFNVIESDVGRPLLDITHRLETAGLDADIESVIATLRMIEREVRASDGCVYQLRILPYRTTDDRIGGAVLTFFDVTLRKRAEDAVQRSESWLRLLIESVRDYAIIRLDPQGTIMSWNPAAAEIFGYTEAEAVGQPFGMLHTPEDRASGRPEATLRTARETGRSAGELWKMRKDGTRFWASGVTAPLLDASAYGYVNLLRDLTQQQAVFEGREILLASERESRAAAEDAGRQKDLFLATLSHELRNPLALILMQAELLRRAPEIRAETRLAGAAEIIQQMARAQAHFVDDMLDVSRARTGKLAIEPQLLPLSLVLADSIGAFQREAIANDITLDVEIAPEPLFVEADVVRVRQIAWNLLSNAVKFTPHGGRITVRLAREGSNARLNVEDDGRGIPPELLPRVFEWFRQGDAGTTRSKGGMGIGLALVRQLVELHGGRVEAFSRGLGYGSCFSVWLPLQATPGPRESAPFAAPSPAVASDESRQLAGLRLLVIDDLADSAEAMSELLRLEGADVVSASRAREAIELARTRPFDVIISDIAMPGMDGHTMLRELRATPLNAKTPAIAHSGFGGPEDTARSVAAGFQRHLTKPVVIDDLLRAILDVRR